MRSRPGTGRRACSRGPPVMTVSISMPSPSARRSMSSSPRTKRPRFTTFGASGWRRPNASNCEASLAPRATPASALRTRCSGFSAPATSLASNCRLPPMTCSRLLKSCATPPVSLPIASIFCAVRKASSAWRSASRASRSAVTSRPTPWIWPVSRSADNVHAIHFQVPVGGLRAAFRAHRMPCSRSASSAFATPGTSSG